jgi:hypothetical protein
MKTFSAASLLVIGLGVLLTTPGWARGLGGMGGGGHGSHSGGSHAAGGAGQFGQGFHGSFGNPGLALGPGHPAVPAHGFGHFQAFEPENRFGLHHHFGPGGFGVHSFGFFGGSGFVDDRFGTGALVEGFPFVCVPHRFGFTDQAQFFAHLNFAHRVPLDRAAAFCTPVGDGSRLIFFGF